MNRASKPSAIQVLVDQLSRLPGIGKGSAERLAFHMLKQSDDDVLELSRAIADLIPVPSVPTPGEMLRSSWWSSSLTM